MARISVLFYMVSLLVQLMYMLGLESEIYSEIRFYLSSLFWEVWILIVTSFGYCPCQTTDSWYSWSVLSLWQTLLGPAWCYTLSCLLVLVLLVLDTVLLLLASVTLNKVVLENCARK